MRIARKHVPSVSRFLLFPAVVCCILLFMNSAGPETSSRPAVEPGPALVHTAIEAAAIIGGTCKPSWLRQQAREKKIPCRKIGGAYNFSDADIAEILAIFEQRPAARPATPAPARTARQRPATRPAEASPPAGVTQLKPRQPRTLRRLQASA